MNMQKLLISLFVVLILLSEASHAGNRGYLVVFFDKSQNLEWKVFFKKYREHYDLKTIDSCWGNRNGEWIGTAYIDRIPSGIDSNLVSRAKNKSLNSTKALSTILANYRDDLVGNGFDGIYIAENKRTFLEITGISSSGESITVKERLPLTLKKFDLMLCKASKAFDTNFNP